ncbi:MAG: hypothetical protein ACKVU1_09780 [bacterium]
MKVSFVIALCVALGVPGPTVAQEVCDPGSRQFKIEFGNSWGHATQGPAAGSPLDVVGRLTKTQPNQGAPILFDQSPASEYTFHITGVDLDAFIDSDPDTFMYGGGGTITIYYDTSKDAPRPPTASPPNGNVPSLFTDGSPILVGTIDDLLINFSDAGGAGPDSTGEIRGSVTFVSGDSLGALVSPFWVWNATVSSNFFFSVPTGYNWLWSGELKNDCPPPNPVEATTWGNIKGLYR